MPSRPVVTYPARVLKHPAAAVGAITPSVRELATDIVDTMRSSPGCVGVAAPQIGVPWRALAVDVSVMRRPPAHNHGLVVLLDPEVVHASGSELGREGCMSVPDYTCDVRRAAVLILDRVASARTDIFPRKRYAAPGEHLR